MMARCLHRRALLAFAVLPLLALMLTSISMLSVDRWFGDGLSALGEGSGPWLETWRHAAFDLPPVLIGAYLLGTLPWLGGLLLGHQPPLVSASFLALCCAFGGLVLSSQVNLPWHAPQTLTLAFNAAVAGMLYALLTHRPGHQSIARTEESTWPQGAVVSEISEESLLHSSLLGSTTSLHRVSTLDPHDLPTTLLPEL